MTSFLIAPERSAARQPDFSAQPLRRRLLELPLFDIEACGTQFLEELRAFNRSRLSNQQLLEALDVFRLSVEPLLSRLEILLVSATPPLSADARRIVALVARMLRELAHAHARPVLGPRTVWSRFGSKGTLYAPLVRALDFNARRIAFAYRFYAKAPRGAWARMHELYAVALKWRLASRQLSSPRTSALSIYRKALLLDFAEPARLAPTDFRRVSDFVARFGDAARVVVQALPNKPDGVFVIDALRDSAGIALSKYPDPESHQRSVLLGCAPLIRRIARQIEALEAGKNPLEIGLPADGSTAYYRALLQRLLDNWTGFRRSRSARMSFRPRVDLQIGLEKVWRFLHGGGDLRRGGLSEAANRTRGTNDWTILNESAGGFALRHVRGAVPRVGIGDIVAIKPTDRDEIVVAMIRWIHSETGDQMDIGVQLLAPKLEPVMMGIPGSIDAAFARALFAPPASPFNRVPVLVATSRLIRLNRKLVVRSVAEEFQVQPHRMLETTHHIDLVQVSVT